MSSPSDEIQLQVCIDHLSSLIRNENVPSDLLINFAKNLIFFFSTADNAAFFLKKDSAWRAEFEASPPKILHEKSSLVRLRLPPDIDSSLFSTLAAEAFLQKNKMFSLKIFLLLVEHARFLQEKLKGQPCTLQVARGICAEAYFDNSSEAISVAELFKTHGFVQRTTLSHYQNLLKTAYDYDERLRITTSNNGYVIRLLEKREPIIAILGKIIGNCEHLEGNYFNYVERAMTDPNAGYYGLFDKRKQLVAYSFFLVNRDQSCIKFFGVYPIRNFLERDFGKLTPAEFLTKLWTEHALAVQINLGVDSALVLRNLAFPLYFNIDSGSVKQFERTTYHHTPGAPTIPEPITEYIVQMRITSKPAPKFESEAKDYYLGSYQAGMPGL